MRENILKIATEYFSKKGYAQTTISDISGKLNINEATIYGYFKSKEDILLNIPLDGLQAFLKSLTEHLQGIKGADNKLRKVVWHQLHFCQNNREYTALLLLEVRPNLNFYQSPAYELIKEYSNMLINIIEEGKREGTFGPEVNERLIRDMILGTLDHVTLPWVILGRDSNIVDKTDALSDLFLNAISKRDAIDSHKMARKEQILSVATRLFAKKGYTKSTISEIANLVGISESTIYEYFKNKEEILFTIPERKLEDFLSNLEEIISPKGPYNRLRKLVWHQLNFFQTHREYTTVLLFELRFNPKFYTSAAYRLIRKYSDVLLNIIEEGKEKGIFEQQINARLVRDMIFGTLDHVTLPWIVTKRESNLMDRTEEVCDLFLKAITKSKKFKEGEIYV